MSSNVYSLVEQGGDDSVHSLTSLQTGCRMVTMVYSRLGPTSYHGIVLSVSSFDSFTSFRTDHLVAGYYVVVQEIDCYFAGSFLLEPINQERN